MLIIAIPKSASTALMSTLAGLHGVPGTQVFFPNAPRPEGFDVLRRYHSDVRSIDAALAAQFATERQVFKQHLPPTSNNVACLSGCKKVILLREPAAIIAAYRRARQRFLSVSMPGFNPLASEEAWIRRARENGLYTDLERFVSGWSDNAVVNKRIIWYDDLVRDPTRTINAIEGFWGWEITPGPIQLLGRRYSGRGAWRRGLFNVARAFLKWAHLWDPARAGVRKLGGWDLERWHIE